MISKPSRLTPLSGISIPPFAKIASLIIYQTWWVKEGLCSLDRWCRCSWYRCHEARHRLRNTGAGTMKLKLVTGTDSSQWAMRFHLHSHGVNEIHTQWKANKKWFKSRISLLSIIPIGCSSGGESCSILKSRPSLVSNLTGPWISLWSLQPSMTGVS